MKTYKSFDKTVQIKYDKKRTILATLHEDSVLILLSKILSSNMDSMDIEIDASRDCITVNKTEDIDLVYPAQTLIKLTGFTECMPQTLQVDYWELYCVMQDSILTVTVKEL